MNNNCGIQNTDNLKFEIFLNPYPCHSAGIPPIRRAARGENRVEKGSQGTKTTLQFRNLR